MLDLHRHDEFSTFDGFGKPMELAKLAKKLGHSSLSITNHGTTNGLVKHYLACKEVEINCVMGVESYFQPVINKEKPRYHLCLIAKNLKGYENINALMYKGEQQKYYVPLNSFADLEEFSEGIICSSACISGFLSQAIKAGNMKLAKRAMAKFKSIFKDDFYVEIQPYKLSDVGLQESINEALMLIAKQLDIKCILTSDSHYGRKEDFDTYLKMHEIAAHKYDIKATYGERYMPTEKELMHRFYKMHRDKSIKGTDHECRAFAKEMIRNLEEIEDKIEQHIFEALEQKLPKFSEANSEKLLKSNVIAGLKDRGKGHDKEYIERCKEELAVINLHGFADYFLMVQDYVLWAKDNGIAVGPGRGSVCNCQVAWALRITDVDSLRLGLDFRRFLRDDKNKLPDIDLDFETSRRQEVIDYIIQEYPGNAAQICSYGLYRVDNLINDLAKVCGLPTTGKDLDDQDKIINKRAIAELKKYIKDNLDPETESFIYESMMDTRECKMYNKDYDNIIKHFAKMFKKMRFVGTHAAGVAVTSSSLLKYSALKIKDGKPFTVYDLSDLDEMHVVKFDMLGLKTMESIGELRRLTNVEGVTEEMMNDKAIYEEFAEGHTDGIFQFESSTARNILKDIQTDCFEDTVAASSMNRPGPLSLKMPQLYANNKFNIDDAKLSPFYQYTEETYGTIVYQEQVQLMCVEIGNLTWGEADKVMKLMKNAIASMGELDAINKSKHELTEKFCAGAIENGYDPEISRNMFEHMLVYTFNKGHAAGYSLISLEEMYYKLYYPMEYWYTKLKYCGDDIKVMKFKEQAIVSGAVLFLPHVNYTADFTMRKVDGEMTIQEGLSSIKNVGEKASAEIVAERKKNGVFKSYDDFYDRCKSRLVNVRVIETLLSEGALQFNKKKYVNRVTKYNSALYMRGASKR